VLSSILAHTNSTLSSSHCLVSLTGHFFFLLLQVSFFMARLRTAHDGTTPETNLDNDNHASILMRVPSRGLCTCAATRVRRAGMKVSKHATHFIFVRFLYSKTVGRRVQYRVFEHHGPVVAVGIVTPRRTYSREQTSSTISDSYIMDLKDVGMTRSQSSCNSGSFRDALLVSGPSEGGDADSRALYHADLQVVHGTVVTIETARLGSEEQSRVVPVALPVNSQVVVPSPGQTGIQAPDLIWNFRTKQWLSHEQIASSMSGLGAIALIYASDSESDAEPDTRT
jgi:hypothetical protein